MKIIQQENDYDCVKACIAMLSGKTLAEVKEVVPDNGEPMNTETELALLAYFQLGVKPTGSTIYEKNRGMITVPSLNFSGLNHAICFKSGKGGDPIEIFDPQKGRKDKDYYHSGNIKCWSNVWNIVTLKSMHKSL